MVIKIYISGISGNKEVKKRQQRVLMILDSKNVEYQVIDITEPGKEAEKEFMQLNSMAKDSKYPLPPQIFNEEDYCGDYEDFDEANEMDELEKFLRGVSASTDNSEAKSQKDAQQNGNSSSREPSADKDILEDDGTEERRLSETEKNDKLSDTENKDLSEGDNLEKEDGGDDNDNDDDDEGKNDENQDDED